MSHHRCRNDFFWLAAWVALATDTSTRGCACGEPAYYPYYSASARTPKATVPQSPWRVGAFLAVCVLVVIGCLLLRDDPSPISASANTVEHADVAPVTLPELTSPTQT